MPASTVPAITAPNISDEGCSRNHRVLERVKNINGFLNPQRVCPGIFTAGPALRIRLQSWTEGCELTITIAVLYFPSTRGAMRAAFALLVLVLSSMVAQAEKRVALVIGIDKYDNLAASAQLRKARGDLPQ